MNWMGALDNPLRDEAARLIKKLLQVAKRERGPTLFNNDECHHITEVTVEDVNGYRKEKIWQLIGRNTRVC